MGDPSTVFPLFLFVALCALVAAFVFGPLRAPTRAAAMRDAERARLLAEKEEVLRTIRELDFDVQTDKLAESDYASLRESYEARGVELLRRLDELDRAPGEEELEAEVVRMRESLKQESGHV